MRKLPLAFLSRHRVRPMRPRLVAIYSRHGYLLGRAPLACLFAWNQAAFAIGRNGKRYVKGGGK